MPADATEITLRLASAVDVLRARRECRRLATLLELNAVDIVKLETAVSEIASNAVTHACDARITMRLTELEHRTGVLIVVSDAGPGIADVAAALQDGYSTQRSLGIGLGAARRMMDEFEIASEVGKGTTVTMTKWKPK